MNTDNVMAHYPSLIPIIRGLALMTSYSKEEIDALKKRLALAICITNVEDLRQQLIERKLPDVPTNPCTGHFFVIPLGGRFSLSVSYSPDMPTGTLKCDVLENEKIADWRELGFCDFTDTTPAQLTEEINRIRDVVSEKLSEEDTRKEQMTVTFTVTREYLQVPESSKNHGIIAIYTIKHPTNDSLIVRVVVSKKNPAAIKAVEEKEIFPKDRTHGFCTTKVLPTKESDDHLIFEMTIPSATIKSNSLIDHYTSNLVSYFCECEPLTL